MATNLSAAQRGAGETALSKEMESELPFLPGLINSTLLPGKVAEQA